MPNIELSLAENDVSVVLVALYAYGGEIAATEARRTGGRGFASGGKARHLEDVHRIADEIKAARDA